MKCDLSLLKLELLETGGVDNWEWYEESISNYCENNSLYRDEMDDYDLLIALEQGGVDNWEWYDESLGYFNSYADYINSLTEGSVAKNFETFSKEKDEEDAKERARLHEENKAKELKEAKENDASVKPEIIESVKVMNTIKEITGVTDESKLKEIYYDFVKNSNILKQNAGFKKEFVESIQAECFPGGGGITGARTLYLDTISSRPKFKKFFKEYYFKETS